MKIFFLRGKPFIRSSATLTYGRAFYKLPWLQVPCRNATRSFALSFN